MAVSLPATHSGAAADRAAPRRVAVSRLRLTDFRNYRSLDLDVAGDIVVLTGPNGAGKTNLIEALSLLSPGKGLRHAGLAELLRRGAAGPWTVLADLAAGDATVTVATGLTVAPGHDAAQGKRILRIDGNTVPSHRALADHVSVVWLTPDMDQLLRGSAGQRRKFIDRLVFGFDQDHAGRVTAYTRAVAERARILKRFGGNGGDRVWLATVEARAAAFGVAIAATRREVVAKLNGALDKSPADALPPAHIAIDGSVEDWLGEVSALDAEERLKAALAASRGDDALAGRTRYGPHRSDLLVTHAGRRRAASECSTGEQKALLATLVLAYVAALTEGQMRTPLVLLDEAAAHLDTERREALFSRLLQQPAQIWLTGTEAAQFAKINEMIQNRKSHCFIDNFSIVDGRVRRLDGAP